LATDEKYFGCRLYREGINNDKDSSTVLIPRFAAYAYWTTDYLYIEPHRRIRGRATWINPVRLPSCKSHGRSDRRPYCSQHSWGAVNHHVGRYFILLKRSSSQLFFVYTPCPCPALLSMMVFIYFIVFGNSQFSHNINGLRGKYNVTLYAPINAVTVFASTFANAFYNNVRDCLWILCLNIVRYIVLHNYN